MTNITISGASGQVNITSADQDPAVAVLLEQSAIVTYYGAPGVGAVNGDVSAAWSITNLGTIAGGTGANGGPGILLAAGGSIANGSSVVTSALIEGYYGIYVTGGNASITNQGTVDGIFDAIRLTGDGSVANYGIISATNSTGVLISGTGAVTNGSAADTTAAIVGAVGVYIHVGVATVVNYGSITASFASAVYVYGGSVTNGSSLDTAALISASNIGIQSGFNTLTSTVVNYGTISGGYFAGVDLENTGTVTNGWSNSTAALITSGDFGIYLYGAKSVVVNYATIATTGAFAIAGVSLANGGTVINAGTISGGPDAIVFGSTGADRLVVAPGAVFVGKVAAGGTVGNTLELAANGPGALSDIGANYAGFSSAIVDAGADWTITNGITGATAVTLDGAALTLPGIGLDTSTNFDFEHAGGHDTLTLTGLSGQSNFENRITDVSSHDSFVLPGFDLTGDTVSFDGVHTLTITNSGPNAVFSFSDFAVRVGETLNFTAAGDVVSAACYRRGTHIMTASGERPIEALRIGDAVPTRFGGLQPIKWIGRRSYAAHCVAGNRAVLPVLIRAGALGDSLPSRDLYVSPKHAMFFDNVLVPAELLVNSRTILQPPAAGPVEYFHLEFDTHAVILAEGAASESFVDCDSRDRFDNAAEFSKLYLYAHPPQWRFCAERLEHGAAMEKIRRRIDARAGLRAAVPHDREQSGKLVGNLEHADANGIVGWAFNPDQPDTPVWLEIVGDGVVFGTILANRYRDDLLAAGLGRGRCGFNLCLDPALPAVSLVLRRTIDGVVLGARTVAHT